jgi:hypothetical protein
VFIMEKLCLLFVYDYYGIGEDAAAWAATAGGEASAGQFDLPGPIKNIPVHHHQTRTLSIHQSATFTKGKQHVHRHSSILNRVHMQSSFLNKNVQYTCTEI